MAKSPFLVSFALTTFLILHNSKINLAWFIDQPTTPPSDPYPSMDSNRNLDYDGSRPSSSWQPSGTGLNNVYDSHSVHRPSMDVHPPSHGLDHGVPDSNPSYPSYGFRHSEPQPPPHVPAYGLDRQPASDSYGGPRTFYDRPAPAPQPSLYPSNPYESGSRMDRGYSFDSTRSENPPYAGHDRFASHNIPSPPPSSYSESSGMKLHDCKCICGTDSLRAEAFTNLQNWYKSVQSTTHDVVCLSNSAPATTGYQGPQTLPSGLPGFYWTQKSSFYPGEGPTENVHKPIDVNQIFDKRKDEVTTTPTICITEEPPVEKVVVEPVDPPAPEPVPEPEPETIVPTPEVTEAPEEGNEQALQQNRGPEFKTSGEMSESAVAGLVCGIFAVVVLIVVVVVSRKVIVANAQKTKRKSEEEQIDAYDDPTCYYKTSSSTGYPPRYL